jgi:hypothetical protein
MYRGAMVSAGVGHTAPSSQDVRVRRQSPESLVFDALILGGAATPQDI